MTGDIQKIWEAEDRSSPSVDSTDRAIVKDISNDDVKKRLSRLLELYQEELITEAEYQKRRLEILDEI